MRLQCGRPGTRPTCSCPPDESNRIFWYGMKEATSTDSISRKASKQARMRGEPRFLPSFLFPFPSLDLAWYTTFVINERISREVNLTPLRSPILPSPTNARAPTPVAEKLAWVATPLPPSLPPSLASSVKQGKKVRVKVLPFQARRNQASFGGPLSTVLWAGAGACAGVWAPSLQFSPPLPGLFVSPAPLIPPPLPRPIITQ